MDVGGEDRDQERDQSPGGENLAFRDEKHCAKDDLKNPTYIDKLQMPRQVRRHDLHKRIGDHEMERPCRKEDRREQPFHHDFEDVHNPP
jgi:hypothetical protein